MFENLRKLYKHHGGIASVASSFYFWLAVLFSILSFRSIPSFDWAEVTLTIMPSLAGFTIAAFAIIFAILEPNMLKALVSPDDEGQSPIAAIAASIGHAVLIQILSIIIAILSKLADIWDLISNYFDWILYGKIRQSIYDFIISCINNLFSFLGLFFTFYGVLLVLAAVLSIVRMQVIVTESKNKKIKK